MAAVMMGTFGVFIDGEKHFFHAISFHIWTDVEVPPLIFGGGEHELLRFSRGTPPSSVAYPSTCGRILAWYSYPPPAGRRRIEPPPIGFPFIYGRI